MKSVLTALLSLAILVTFAQERKENLKPITHAPGACPSLVMTPIDNVTTTPADLVEAILGADIQSYSNVAFTGYVASPYASAGLYTGGANAGLGVESGIVMCSGVISNAVGPNASIGISACTGLAGDAQLSAYSGQDTYDATVLEFDFVPSASFNQLFVEFVFGSDEYNEWVNLFNDDFAFFLNGTNIATVPSTNIPITINTINNNVNSIYYKNNDTSPYPFCNEMDGFTTVLVAQGPVLANQTNHIKLAIADGGDCSLDSFVFIKASSFSGVDPEVPVSNWALFIGIGLILIFAVIRFRRLV
jgi:hypothetical protein